MIYTLPESIKTALDDWVSKGWLPGGFTCSVLANDLAGAVCRADHVSLASLQHIVWYVTNELPSPAWGSPAKMRAWVAERFPGQLAAFDQDGPRVTDER